MSVTLPWYSPMSAKRAVHVALDDEWRGEARRDGHRGHDAEDEQGAA